MQIRFRSPFSKDSNLRRRSLPPMQNPQPRCTHLAAFGFPTASFPATPYGFPSSASSQHGSALGSAWPTGRIPINGVGICFSQAFTVPASGTFYFGDIDFYNLTNMRDVVVVSSAAAAAQYVTPRPSPAAHASTRRLPRAVRRRWCICRRVAVRRRAVRRAPRS